MINELETMYQQPNDLISNTLLFTGGKKQEE